VRPSTRYGQFAKVLIKGYQNLAMRKGVSKNIVVARVFNPIPDPVHIVPRSFQIGNNTAPDAGVEQEPQLAEPRFRASIRSLPITFRA